MRSPARDEIHKMRGPALLLAGPGTGKTYQLAKRIKFLVEDTQVDPSSIAVITFTAAAAANMRSRISDTRKPELHVPQELQPDLICTMHSLGYRIVREHSELLRMPVPPSVVQADRAKAMLMCDAAQLAGHHRKDADETRLCRQYGRCQRDDSRKCQICRQYRSILKSCGAIDYDDQILLACRLLRKNPEVAKEYRQSTQHLLVDEYQDINAGQFELIRLLSQGQEIGLFVVGDDDQSIYSWRGGSPEFIRKFEQHFGDNAKVETLRHSRRCPRKVLESAFAVVTVYDSGRRAKGQFSYADGLGEGNPITVHSVPSDNREATIVQKIVAESLPSKQVLVLVPNRGYAKLICEQLRRRRIAFVSPEPLPGQGLPLIERFISWFRDEEDNLALRECIESMLNGRESPLPSSRAKKADKVELREKGFLAVSDLWRAVAEAEQSFWAVLSGHRGDDPVLSYLKKGLTDLRETTANGDVPALLANVARTLQPWRSVNDLMEEIQTWVSRLDQGTPGAEPGVRVMTFQGAKGLEADVVCVIGVEEGAIPRAGCDGELLAEQARLFFVSMTRAKSDLHLVHVRNRSAAVSFRAIHKAGGSHMLARSRFLDALPKGDLDSVYHR